MDKERVLNLRDVGYPSVEYPENTIRVGDTRLAAFMAREFWETKRRHDSNSSTKVVMKSDELPTWEERDSEDIKIDIKAFFELLNRGIIE